MMVERSRESLATVMAAVLLIGAGILLQFYHLSRPGFYQDAPARTGAYVLSMNMSGDWMAPRLDGGAQLDVSPLHLWSIKVASRLRPVVEAFHVRVPGAACALLLSLLVAWWFYIHAMRYGREDMAEVPPEGFALVAGLVTASSPFLIVAGRSGTPAAMFTLIWLAAAFCWGESLEARRSFYAGRPWRVWVVWGYVLAGFGMLLYGPFILALLMVPYFMAARAYRLRRPSTIHIGGICLAAAIGASWTVGASLLWPERLREIWLSWLMLPFAGQPSVNILWRAGLFALVHLPWLLLALIMAVRVWLRKDRSPTLVFWMSSLIGVAVLLGIAGPRSGGLLLPLVPLVALLAADALYRWNFEHAGSLILRIVMRLTLAVGLIGGFALALLTESDIGMALIGLLAIAWLVWTIRARRHGIIYTQWQTTARLATIIILMLIACEAAVLSDWVSREYLFHSTIGYFARVEQWRKALNEPPSIYAGRRIPGLYAYYLGSNPPRPALSASDATSATAPGQILFARGSYDKLSATPGIIPLTVNPRGANERNPYDKMYYILPRGADPTTNPLRIALIGNSGTRRSSVRDVARAINRETRNGPIDNVLMLGNNVWGPKIMDHLDFTDSFERPFRRLLQKGVMFHAVLGREDQSYALVQAHYPPFHMEGRYYSFTLRDGLVECFMLDSERIVPEKGVADPQVDWLSKALAASRAKWKIVCMYDALLTASPKGRVSEQLAAKLVPLFERSGVSLVAWGRNPWYERLRRGADGPVYINGGMTGGADETSFGADPLLQAANSEHGGFVLLDVTARSMSLRTMNRKGMLIDKAEIAPSLPTARPRP